MDSQDEVKKISLVERVAELPQAKITADGSASRRSTLTLPNGVVVQYGYDLDSRVQSIACSYGGTSIGNLAYAYDQAGRKTYGT